MIRIFLMTSLRSGLFAIVSRLIGLGALIQLTNLDYVAFRNRKKASIQHTVGKEHIAKIMRTAGLDPASKKWVGKYSLGMRQRLGIAQDIMEEPTNPLRIGTYISCVTGKFLL